VERHRFARSEQMGEIACRKRWWHDSRGGSRRGPQRRSPDVSPTVWWPS